MCKLLRKIVLGSAVGFLLLTGVSAKTSAKEATIESGVYIGNIDLSGLTDEQAKAQVSAFIDSLQEKTITLQGIDEHEVTVTAGDLGLSWGNADVLDHVAEIGKKGNLVQRYKALADLHRDSQVYPLELSVDKNAITTILNEQCKIYDQEAINATLTRVDGQFQVTEGQSGIVVDVEDSLASISDYIRNDWDYSDVTLALAVEVEEPQGNAETLSKVKDVLGTYTTSYSTSGDARSTNVANGCRLINGHTLYPGEQLSVLECITPFSEENGYRLAGSYLNGQVVESLGGGICQVSTTLYNAVLRSELQVDERSNHSMIIGYVKPSEDAAIAESSGKDFKFTNNLDYPIYIEGSTTSDKHISFTVYGVETRPSDRVVSFESEVLETTTPPTETIIQDGGAPIGSVSVQGVHIGYKARLWKIVTEGGKEISREQINSSSYKAVPRTATVGVATDNPEYYNMMQAAIATGSIDQVKATAAGIAAAAAAQQAEAEAAAAAAAGAVTEDQNSAATDG